MKKKSATASIVNKRASFDYDIKETLVAGIVLTGAETKSLRMGSGHLRGAFCTIKDGELWLNNATIMATNINKAHLPIEQQTKARKLLVSKKQIKELQDGKEQGLTIIPLKLLTKGRFIKLEIALARGRKKYDKRQVLKKRDETRDIHRAMKLG